jgi:hypothetical protein
MFTLLFAFPCLPRKRETERKRERERERHRDESRRTQNTTKPKENECQGAKMITKP